METRQLLSAGNVMVAAPVAGILTITGDGSDDAVQVSGSTTDAGTFTIKGLKGTLVNGVANGSVTETGVTSIQTASWGDGNDFFGFSDDNSTGLAGDLTVLMGNGNDRVALGKSGEGDDHGDWDDDDTITKVGGNVQVTLGTASGTGNDRVEVENFSVSGNQGFLVTLPGSGNDKVEAEKVTVTAGAGDITGDQGFGVVMGDGNDKFNGENIKVTASTSGTITGRQGFGVQMGNGNNRFEAEGVSVTLSGTVAGKSGFGVQMGNGNDKVEAEKVSVTGGQGLAVVLGNGNDHVSLGGQGWQKHRKTIDVAGDILVQLGTGHDNVYGDNITAGGNFSVQKTTADGQGANVELDHVTVGATNSLSVDTSGDAARDRVRIEASTAATLDVTTGSGDDTVILGDRDHRHGHGHGQESKETLNNFTTAFVNLGAGDDTLKVSDTTITTANFDGGTGTNTYVEGEDTTINTLNKTNFV